MEANVGLCRGAKIFVGPLLKFHISLGEVGSQVHRVQALRFWVEGLGWI